MGRALQHIMTGGAGPGFEESCTAWISALADVSCQLHDIAGSTEDEFLAIGGRLQDFYRRAGQITEMSNEVVRLVSGEEVREDIDRLHEILRIMAEYLSHADHEAREGASTFSTIIDHLEKVGDPLSGFKKINKSLSMLGISTKIESARLGHSAAGFDTLANDVAKLSVQVTEKSNKILGQKDELSALIRQTLLKVVSSAEEQRIATRIIIDRTNESLATLNDVNVRCSSAAGVISGVSTEVAGNIAAVVTSLQFHDITRQQIEHVHETLDELSSRLQQFQEAASDDLIRDVGDLCELQVAQLDHARNELLSAVRTILDSLRAIVMQESQLSGHAQNITGVADTAGTSFFTRMEEGLSQVTVALGESVEESRNLSVAMGQVAGTVGTITQFVGDIEQIGQEIELIALNAQIKAAHTGSEGAALGVLAEAIQRLSHETRVHTTVVSEALRGITDFIENLCQNFDEDASDMDTEVHQMEKDLRRLLDSLRRINEDLVMLLGRIEHEVQSLSDDIERATGGITVHETVVRVLARSSEALARIMTEARGIVPAAQGAERADRLREVSGRYTMHSERTIHASLAGGIPGGAVPAAAAVVVAEQDGGFGDNVELF